MSVCRLRFRKLSTDDQLAIVEHLSGLVERLSLGKAKCTILRYDGEHHAVRDGTDPDRPTTTQQLAYKAKREAGDAVAALTHCMDCVSRTGNRSERKTMCRMLLGEILTLRWWTFERNMVDPQPVVPVSLAHGGYAPVAADEVTKFDEYLTHMGKLSPKRILQLEHATRDMHASEEQLAIVTCAIVDLSTSAGRRAPHAALLKFAQGAYPFKRRHLFALPAN